MIDADTTELLKLDYEHGAIGIASVVAALYAATAWVP